MTSVENFSLEEARLIRARENASKKISLAKMEGRPLEKYLAELEACKTALFEYRKANDLLTTMGRRKVTGKVPFEQSIQPRLAEAIEIGKAGKVLLGLARMMAILKVGRESLIKARKRGNIDLTPFIARRDEAVAAVSEYRKQFGLPALQPRNPQFVKADVAVKIVPVNLDLMKDPERRAWTCCATRLALDKRKAANRIAAGREENRKRIASIEAAKPQKPLYTNWD